MSFKRWLPTFLAFPIGGFIAIQTIGSLDDPIAAAAGGLIAGAVIGAGQWLALRSSGIGRRWIGYTAAAMAAGNAISVAVTDAGTERADVMLAGLITGGLVGAAQSALLPRAAALWTAVTAGGWALAWLVTSQVIVDIERGHAVFGSSGAVVVTVLTGLTLRRVA
ncbi:MAG TPA: hypothetical protein VFZ00_05560 [Solirubrobacter sp.]|nr:hypothetical protein [Solirubrobacter sp.]